MQCLVITVRPMADIGDGSAGCAPAQRYMRVGAMPVFIFDANIAHFKSLLTTETDVTKIATIRKLLAEEERKLAEWRAINSRSNGAE